MTIWLFRCVSCGHEQRHDSHSGPARMDRQCDECGREVRLA